LHQVALAVQRAPSLTEKLRRIAEGLRETGWRRVVILLCDPQEGQPLATGLKIVDLIMAGLAEGEEHEWRQRLTQPDFWQPWLAGQWETARLGQSYFVPGRTGGEVWQADDVLFIPVHDQLGRVVCVIILDAPLDNRRPTSESLRIVELFAQEAAANIETAQLYQALQEQIIVLGERAQRLALLNRVSGMVGTTLNLRVLLSNVSEQVVEAFGVDHCMVMLADQDGRVGHCVAEYPPRGLAGFAVSLAASPLFEQLGAEPKPVEINVVANGAALGAEVQQWLRRFEIEMGWIVPFLAQGRFAGWLGLNFIKRQRSLPPDQVELCQTIANHTAAAVENAALFERVQSALHELEATNRMQAQLLATVQELSTPVVPVLEGILILPIVGFIDSDRAQRIMEGLLLGIEQNRAQVVLLDVTGVPVVDSGVADHLMRAARAAQLLGARPVLVGIRPEVAQAIVGLGVHLRDLVTRGDLQSGLEYALALTRRQIVTLEDKN
jgi:rsbT co-antagonist protein RsbR